MEKVIYVKSLTAKLVLRRGFSIEVYQGLKDVISTHKDATSKMSFDQEKVSVGKKDVALIKSFKKNMVIYLGMNPAKVAKKYNVTDASKYICYKDYPTKLIIKDEKDLDNACTLLDKVLVSAGAKELVVAPYVDYEKVLNERSFGQLFKEGYIRSYVKNISEEEMKAMEEKAAEIADNSNTLEMGDKAVVEEEDDDTLDLVKVTFTAKLEGVSADSLYVISNYVEWNPDKAIKMEEADGLYTLTEFYPRGMKLEFKITNKNNWEGVEKGMFGEEIQNHTYDLTSDIEVEDIIHSFREE